MPADHLALHLHLPASVSCGHCRGVRRPAGASGYVVRRGVSAAIRPAAGSPPPQPRPGCPYQTGAIVVKRAHWQNYHLPGRPAQPASSLPGGIFAAATASTGQRPVRNGTSAPDTCGPGGQLPAPHPGCSRTALTQASLPGRAASPAVSASPHVQAIPADIGAGGASISHHLASRQANTAHPAVPGDGLLCLLGGQTLMISHDQLPSRTRPRPP